MKLRTGLVALLAFASLAALPTSALARWNGQGSDRASAKARTMTQVAQPTASVSNRNVTVSWSAPSGGAPPTGYQVSRYNDSGVVQTIGSGCTGTVAATSCTETAVPSGTWRYRVTAVRANWRATESAASAAATVASPTLTLTQASVTTLPATLTGQIQSFISSQTVTFRLDSASGTVLTGSITPSTVPATGTATVNVTLPAGTAAGAHTIYARGSSGETATAPISVLVPQTLITSAWDLRDASSGTESNVSDLIAFASDGRTLTTSAPPTAFSTSRYLQIDANAPLATNATPSSATFNMRFAAGSATSTACFYFDVRRSSTGAVLATHGSSTTPVGCVTGTTQTNFSTALPTVNSTAIANDLRVRVYMRATTSVAPIIDQAGFSVVTNEGTYALYDRTFTDLLNGSTTTRTWPLVASGGTTYVSASAWPTAFSSSRYLRLIAPSYIPSDATVSGAEFLHRFRRSGGGSACWYLEVLQGSTVIGTHGSASTPIGCTSGNTYREDTVDLPEINTPARANGAVLKIYVRSTTGNSSELDQAQLTVDYAN